MNGHLCLDLKISGKNRKCFYKAVTHGTVSGHNVLDITFEKAIDGTTDNAVSKIVERTFILSKICRGKAISDYHVCSVLQNFLTHLCRKFRRICIVPVNHQITLCVNITEHTADYIAFALLKLVTDNGAFFPRDFICTICGIVIIYVDHSLRKCFSHVTDNLGYSLAFVIARYQNCYFIWHLYFFSPVKLLCFLTDPLTVARVLFLVNSPGCFFPFIAEEAYL